MLSPWSLGRRRSGLGVEAPLLATLRILYLSLLFLVTRRRFFGMGDEAPVLSTSSGSRRRFFFGVADFLARRFFFGLADFLAPLGVPRDSRLRQRSDDGVVDDDEDASEISPDPPIDRRKLVLRVSVADLASLSARESHGAMDCERSTRPHGRRKFYYESSFP